jgi:GNAT superfamily N-acetyltransferase
MLENIPVKMLRPHLRDIPPAVIPPGFRIRGMSEADIPLWTAIERDAEPFLKIGDDLFMQEFGHDLPAIAERCYLILTDQGAGVGTISAWYDRVESGSPPGRIHWVATRPAYQRRGLARAGLSYALNRLAEWHEHAVLGTSSGRLGAIQLYLDFGFVPDMQAPRADEAWSQVRTRLQHPALA